MATADALTRYADAYCNTQGPGDSRPTALQIVQDNHCVGQWSGKVVLITGATSGIGVETARALHETGADVYIMARSKQKAEDVVDDILKSSNGKGKLEYIELDLEMLNSVKRAAEEFLGRSTKLNVLINNAALSQRFPRAPFFVSSSSHRYSQIHWDDVSMAGKYDPFVAYGQSKTASIWTANYIDWVYGPRGVRSMSLHPGGIFTNLQQYAGEEQMQKWKSSDDVMPFMMNPDQGAATTLWAAMVDQLSRIGGKYLADCTIAPPATNATSALDSGVAAHAYSPEDEDSLWALSAGKWLVLRMSSSLSSY